MAAAAVIFERVIPEWSAKSTEFETKREYRIKNYKQATVFAADPNLLKLGHGVYCCIQKTTDGPLHRATLKRAKAAIALWSPKVTSWTYKEFMRAACTRIITPKSCFPCHQFASTGDCYHVMGVWIREKDDADASASDDDDLSDIVDDKTQVGTG